uniref:NAD-dependent epimerase/dehydratase domain-containing protein n=1 Tax=viral metagenome TaxID=1070528 RepID=A0A6C0KG04_9ZZZZ
MKILVTGGSGLVGSSIQKLIYNDDDNNDEYIFISSKDCDLTDIKQVFSFFATYSFQYIIHLAANVGGLYKNMRMNVEMLSDNVKINENVLAACHHFNIQRGIFCLSSCVFPHEPTCFPMDETMLHESPPHSSNEGYAYSKRLLEVQCRNYNKQYGREYICVIPVNLYGPSDNFKLGDAHVIPELIHRMYNSVNEDIQQERLFKIYGTGIPLRQFLYVDDFAEIILELLASYPSQSIKEEKCSIICCNDEVTIKDVAFLIAHFIGLKREKISFDTSKSDGCLRKTVTNKYFKSLYPCFKFTSLTDGLKTTIEWFNDHYPNIRM